MKKLWKENRVVFMLITIILLCFIAICVVSITFFYSKDASTYGDRLADIEKYPITKKFKTDYEAYFKENESVTKYSLDIKGRIIYVNLKFNSDISLEDAKTLATNSLSLFTEELLSYYDIEFVLTSDNFAIIGAKNAVIDHVTWNNNLEVKEEDEDEES